MTLTDRNEMRKQMFAEMEEKLFKDRKPEDSSFYYHSSEDRIVLSHALFWVMTQNIKRQDGKAEVSLVAPSISGRDARSIPHFIPRLQRLASLLQCPLRYAAQYPYE